MRCRCVGGPTYPRCEGILSPEPMLIKPALLSYINERKGATLATTMNAATSERARSRVFDPGFATSSKSFAGIVASILAAAFAAFRAPE